MRTLALRATLVIPLLAPAGACDRSPTAPAPATSQPTTRSDIGPMYFSRAARFDRVGDRIVAIDPNAPRMVTMDPWPELVFQMADGQRTVNQLRAHLAAQYDKGAPAGLDEQVHSIVRDLEREHLIRLHKDPAVLPFYLAKPVAEQDPDEARKAMDQDGFGRRPRK